MSTKFKRKIRFNYLLTFFIILILIFFYFFSGCIKKTKIYQVGILLDGKTFNDMVKGFKTKMIDLGYIENENIVYDLQYGKLDPVENKRLAEKFVTDKVDLIFSLATFPTIAAYEATKKTDVPVVFAYIDTDNSKMIKSIREPGGNITGVRYPGPELQVRRLEILKEIAPNVKRVWIGYDVNSPANEPTLKPIRKTALNLDITLIEVPAKTIDDLKSDLSKRDKLNDPGFDAIILMPDGFNHMPNNLEMISQFTSKHKIPLGGSFLYTVKAGALFGNANDIYKVGELAAPIVDKILKGTSPGTIPVVTPDQYLIINYKLAQELDLTVPEELLNQAEKIIK